MTGLAAILLVGLAGAALQGALLARRWSRGGPAEVDWPGGLARLPRAYLGAVHRAVARDPYAARMHALVAGGLLGASLLIMLAGLAPAHAAPFLAGGVLLLAALGAGGAAMAARRRRKPRPRRLSGGSYDVLPAALAAFAAAAAVLALDALVGLPAGIRWAALGLGAAAVAWLVRSTGRGPMRHALAGAVHLAAHSRPLRLAGEADTGLRPLDLDAERLGAGTVRDLPWNRLASYDACVQCGRCEAACPAFRAGQPLNPKKLVNDLVVASGAGIGRDYAGSPHPGLPVAAPAGIVDLVAGPGTEGAIRPETLWACTTCRACVHECPMLIEHVDAVIDLRRFQTLECGEVPAKAAETLRELRSTDTASGRLAAARLDWAVDLNLPRLAERGSCDVLLWLGEGAFDRRHQRTLRALVALLRRAGVDFAVLGEEEVDCGDLARRLGDEATFQRLARATIATLARYRFSRILTADPHVLHSLAVEYRALGGEWEVAHHTTFLQSLVAEGRLPAGSDAGLGVVTYHDPCYLGRYAGEIAAPRALLAAAGAAPREMERSGLRSSCCGAGGGAALADIPGERRIPDQRMDDARATGAAVVAVACPYCAQMLEGVVGPRPEVLDVAEILLKAVEPAR